MRASPHACLQRARTLRTLTALTALTPDSSGELLAATKTKLDNLQQTVTKLGSEHDEAERAECAARNALREASLKVFNTSFDLAHAQQSVEQLNDYKHKLEEAARPVDPKEYARLEREVQETIARINSSSDIGGLAAAYLDQPTVGDGFALSEDRMTDFDSRLDDVHAVRMCQRAGDKSLVGGPLQSCTQPSDGTTTGWTRSGSCVWDPMDSGAPARIRHAVVGPQHSDTHPLPPPATAAAAATANAVSGTIPEWQRRRAGTGRTRPNVDY